MAAQKAQDLGSYHLTALIGQGGMGEVWRATHKLLAREAAIKIVRTDLINSASARQADVAIQRFEREAHVLGRLQSSNDPSALRSPSSLSPAGRGRRHVAPCFLVHTLRHDKTEGHVRSWMDFDHGSAQRTILLGESGM